MSLYFRNTLTNEPYVFDTIGNHWIQEKVSRPNGYPIYHYLQTEKGCGRIEIQGKSYDLNEGEGVLIAPFISHAYSAETEGWTTLFVTVAGSMESSISGMIGNRQVIFIEKEQGEQIKNLVCSILKKYGNSMKSIEELPADYHEVLGMHQPTSIYAVRELSVDCYRFLMYFVDGVYSGDLRNEPLYQRYVAPIVKEIETNYSHKLTVSGLSRRVYVTPQYLSRLFGRFLGCSVYEYLTAYRITKAKELLITKPRMEVGYIAGQVGFEDCSHFIAMFKKMIGVTPLEFRTLYKFRN
ncbi:MAG: helix-turn-helix domain-containing protein [Lachnospiraceae bacterium]|nr:helix-turn-helix domain-containing protein [Lachnospiraceae bacterium]